MGPAAVLRHDSPKREKLSALVYSALASTAVFLAANPYFFITPGRYYEIALYMLKLLAAENVPEWALHFEETTPYLYYFTHIFPYALGLPLLVLGLIGFLRAGLAHRRADLLLLAFPIVYFAVVGASHHRFVRYGVPLMPFFALFAARALLVASDNATRRKLAAAVSIGVLVPTAAYALAYVSIYTRPDSRNATAAWVHQHIPPGATVLIEWDKVINRPIDFDRYHRPVATLAQYEAVPAAVDARGVSAARELLADADYIVLTQRHAFRYLRLPERFPEAARFYRDLLGERLGYKIVFHARPYPQLLGVEIPDEGAEQTFREFDHPHVWVLKHDAAP